MFERKYHNTKSHTKLMWLKAGPGKPLLAVKAGFGSGRKKANRNHLKLVVNELWLVVGGHFHHGTFVLGK